MITKHVINGSKVFESNGKNILTINKKEVIINSNVNKDEIVTINKILSKYDMPIVVFRHYTSLGAINKQNKHVHYSNEKLKLKIK